MSQAEGKSWQVVSRGVATRDPLAWLPALPAGDRFYWESAEEGLTLAAGGVAARVESAGEDRFGRTADALRALGRGLGFADESARSAPLLLGGFAFEPDATRAPLWRGFPPARWVLPEWLVVRAGDETHVVRVLARDSHTREAEASALAAIEALERNLPAPDPPAPQGALAPSGLDERDLGFEALAQRALDAIRGGEFEKVVVARSVRVARTAVDPIRALRALRLHRSGTRVFGVERGQAWLVGASPERLVRTDGARVAVDALAGSAARGRNPEEDAELARRLLESKKEQGEHAVVVRALVEALEDRCVELRVPEAPRVHGFAGIQHLWTPIQGRLSSPQPFAVLELAPELHPSPAVAGAPRDAALAWLRRHEPLDRGWYAGLVGWLDGRGDGELTVVLRSALLCGGAAHLFAGAGVVAGSDPEAEELETGLKLRSTAATLAGALG